MITKGKVITIIFLISVLIAHGLSLSTNRRAKKSHRKRKIMSPEMRMIVNALTPKQKCIRKIIYMYKFHFLSWYIKKKARSLRRKLIHDLHASRGRIMQTSFNSLQGKQSFLRNQLPQGHMHHPQTHSFFHHHHTHHIRRRKHADLHHAHNTNHTQTHGLNHTQIHDFNHTQTHNSNHTVAHVNYHDKSHVTNHTMSNVSNQIKTQGTNHTHPHVFNHNKTHGTKHTKLHPHTRRRKHRFNGRYRRIKKHRYHDYYRSRRYHFKSPTLKLSFLRVNLKKLKREKKLVSYLRNHWQRMLTYKNRWLYREIDIHYQLNSALIYFDSFPKLYKIRLEQCQLNMHPSILRCESLHGKGNCEKLTPTMVHKKCPFGSSRVGCCSCAKVCPDSMFKPKGYYCLRTKSYKLDTFKTLTECQLQNHGH